MCLHHDNEQVDRCCYSSFIHDAVQPQAIRRDDDDDDAAYDDEHNDGASESERERERAVASSLTSTRH